jgi:hypothetical protein
MSIFLQKHTSSNPAHGEEYSIQHFVIKFVSDLRQVGGFLWVLLFPPPIKLTVTFSVYTVISSTNKTDRHDITEILFNGIRTRSFSDDKH